MRNVIKVGLLPVVVAALVALGGTGTASASYCSTNTNPCTGTEYTNFEIQSSLKTNTKATFKFNTTTVVCQKASLDYKVEGEILGEHVGKIVSLSFGECGACTVATLNNGNMGTNTEIPGSANGNGRLAADESAITIKCGATACQFAFTAGGSYFGFFIGGKPAIIKANTAFPWEKGDADQMTCTGKASGGTASLTAEYQVTSLAALSYE